MKKFMVEQKTRLQEQTYTRSIPQMETFSDSAKEYQYKKCVMNPCFLNLDSDQEKSFIEQFLEVNDNVLFWYKNGVSSKDYFAVPYEEEGEKHSFYPDFIVYFKDGKVGIFDTKAGFTLKEGNAKAKGLQEYIEKNSDLNLIGGLIKNENGTFYINNKRNYNSENSEDFDLLSTYLKQ